MRTRLFLRLAVVVSATLGVVPGVGFGQPAAFGVAAAEARVFTRKRVNGRWITGRFVAKQAASPSRGRVRMASRGRPSAQDSEPEQVPTPPVRATLGAAAAAAVTAPLLAGTAPAPSAASAPQMDERMLKRQEALRERARAIVMTSTSEVAAAPESSAPAATGSLASAPAANARPEPRSLSFDFQSGLKTTVFANGTSVQEKFDIPSLKGLAAPAPASGAQAGPGPKSVQ